MTGRTREIGRTGLRVPTFGLGCATLGGSRYPVTRDEAEAVLRHAWHQGVRYVDVAPYYGYGAAERRVGDALRDRPRVEWVLSTKVGRRLVPRADSPPGPTGTPRPLPFDAVYDYGYDGVMRSVEHSLQRLGLDRIDMLLVHDIGAQVHGDEHPPRMRELREGGYRALRELRDGGAVRAIGLGVFEREVCLEVLAWGQWDLFLLAGNYTLLGQHALDDLLPACERHGVSLVIGSPLNAGILAGGELWNYREPTPQVRARVQALRATCADFQVPLMAAALQFPLAHPAVAAVVCGPRTPAELDQNLAALRYPVPRELWAALVHQGLLDRRAPVPSPDRR
ncbi:MAG TPA: aldo/keto reductase [Ramlibacter sp.]|nr:aldo/keto reductase [Ramlibacter sp.]